MSTPLPGQRASQRPLKAALASQRAIGRALAATGVLSEVVYLQVGRQIMRMSEDAAGIRTVEPYDPTTPQTQE